MKISFFSTMMVASLVLASCSSSAGVGTAQPAFSDQVESVVAATIQALPSVTPEPALEPACPEPGEGTLLLTREELGYCLLYPQGYVEVDTPPGEVCLVPGEPLMACHAANAFINVEPAQGRSADQAADQIMAEEPVPENIERTSLAIGGEKALRLDGLGGVASSRKIIVVHASRLYTLIFIPWDETGEAWPRIETLYNTIVNSFGFLPTR